MSWGKMDDKFHRNRKIRELRRTKGGMEALGVWSFWWSWCLDDPDLSGEVPKVELARADEKPAGMLVKVGLWEDDGDVYRFHDFHEYNPTSAQVETKKERDRLRAAAKREEERARLDAESLANLRDVASDSCATSRRKTEDVASTRVPVPSRPVPSRPDPYPTQPWLRALVRLREANPKNDPQIFDPGSYREALEWIALKPEEDFAKVLTNYAVEPWVVSNPGKAHPNYVRKNWDSLLDGPMKPPPRGGRSGPATATAFEDFEAEPLGAFNG